MTHSHFELPSAIRKTLDRAMLAAPGPRWHRIEVAVQGMMDRIPEDATETQRDWAQVRMRAYCYGA